MVVVPLVTKYIVTAYYYSSETVYTFGPFTETQLNRFIKKDSTPDKHTEWEVQVINPPNLYGTGKETSLH